MSKQVYYYERGGQKIPIVAPTDVEGFARDSASVKREKHLNSFGIQPLLSRGSLAIDSLAASSGHSRILSSKAPVFGTIRSDSMARALHSQGESNRRLPNRGSFSADKKRSSKSFQRGDSVIHTAAHKRLTIMGPSRSKPGYYKAVDLEGNSYRVHPDNLKRM